MQGNVRFILWEVFLIRAVSLHNTYAEVAMLPGLVLQSAA